MGRSSSPMQLTRAADYAVRAMIHLATLPANERILLPGLAKATAAPVSFLSKVMQALCHAGFVVSRRGQAGGFEIVDAGRNASLTAVMEAIDGPISLNVCMMSGAQCGRSPSCPAHPVWVRAQEAMVSVLNESTVATLAAEALAERAAASMHPHGIEPAAV